MCNDNNDDQPSYTPLPHIIDTHVRITYRGMYIISIPVVL